MIFPLALPFSVEQLTWCNMKMQVKKLIDSLRNQCSMCWCKTKYHTMPANWNTLFWFFALLFWRVCMFVSVCLRCMYCAREIRAAEIETEQALLASNSVSRIINIKSVMKRNLLNWHTWNSAKWKLNYHLSFSPGGLLLRLLLHWNERVFVCGKCWVRLQALSWNKLQLF